MTATRGRPRSTAVDAAVSRSVHALLISGGYPAMSVEQVATVAGVGKATVYRRWASKAEMVFGVVVHGETVEPPQDTGTLAGDIRALTDRVVAVLSAPAARQSLPGLLADLRGDPLLAARFHDLLIDAERRLVATLLDRAVARGELTERPDPVDVHAQLLGTVFAWLYLVSGRPPDDLADRVSRALLAAVRAGRS